MGSVIDYIECPHCHTEAFTDFFYKTGEEYTICKNCGYYHSSTYKRDDKGEYITKDGTDNHNFDNLIIEEKELTNPYGSYQLKYKDSKSTKCGCLQSVEEWDELKNSLLLDPGNDVEFLKLSQFINDEIVITSIINLKV